MSQTDEQTAPEGGSGFNLADELLSLPSSRDDTSYNIPNEVNVAELSSGELASALNAAVDLIASAASIGSDPILGPVGEVDAFDTLRSFLLHFHHLNETPSLQAKLLDAICTGMSNAIDAAVRDESSASDYPTHRDGLERWGFLTHWFVVVAEREYRPKTTGTLDARKKKGGVTSSNKEGWNWAESLPNLLSLMSKAMRVLQSARLWTAPIDRDAFISGCFMRPGFLLIEHEGYLKSGPTPSGAMAHSQLGKGNAIKVGITKLVCQTIKFHSKRRLRWH